MSKSKFKKGDLVRIKPSYIKWFLDNAHEVYMRPSGELAEGYEQMLCNFLYLALWPDTAVIITEHHYPGSDIENFRVSIGTGSNIDAKDLVKVSR